MRREVEAIVVFCTFTDDGCTWKGEVRHLEVLSGEGIERSNTFISVL